MHRVANTLREVLATIMPNCCLLCGGTNKGTVSLCGICQDSIVRKNRGCQVCGTESALSKADICSHCIAQPPPFRQCRSLFHYHGSIRQLIRQFKFHGDFAAGRALSHLLAVEFQKHYQNKPAPNLLIPTPIHHGRLAQRGFNQAGLIAKHVATSLDIQIHHQAVIKELATAPQAELNHEQRRKNLRNAFTLSASAEQSIQQLLLKQVNQQNLPPLRIAIFDDVATTQTTLRELSLCLASLKPQWIDAWTIAQTPAPHSI